MGVGINIASVIVLLGVLIFVHELGHFLLAKSLGVGVLKFSLGFGPKLIGRRVGETDYMISLVPLGGYVKLLGESETDDVLPQDEKRSFVKQHVLRKIAIVIAGPLFNFLFAILAFAVIFMVGVPSLTTEIGSVQSGSPAEVAGLRAGDAVVSIDGKDVARWGDLAEIITKSGGREISLKLNREGALQDVRVKPEMIKTKNIFGEDVDSYKIGVGASKNTFIERQNPIKATWSGIEQTWAITELTLVSIVKMIQGVVSPDSLGGPILIAQMAGANVKKGIMNFVFFMALLSINLAVLNLFPIPVLDGGHLLFFVIELVTGKEVNIKWRERAQQVGFFILVMLMIFVFYNDIMRIFGD
ncbi:MAG TPA: RIP metalloprotease RseP [Syntrophales bacterium]|nr:RIP metalloprotease RseP [Syntrophales bacterium]